MMNASIISSLPKIAPSPAGGFGKNKTDRRMEPFHLPLRRGSARQGAHGRDRRPLALSFCLRDWQAYACFAPSAPADAGFSRVTSARSPHPHAGKPESVTPSAGIKPFPGRFVCPIRLYAYHSTRWPTCQPPKYKYAQLTDLYRYSHGHFGSFAAKSLQFPLFSPVRIWYTKSICRYGLGPAVTKRCFTE